MCGNIFESDVPYCFAQIVIWTWSSWAKQRNITLNKRYIYVYIDILYTPDGCDFSNKNPIVWLWPLVFLFNEASLIISAWCVLVDCFSGNSFYQCLLKLTTGKNCIVTIKVNYLACTFYCISQLQYSCIHRKRWNCM